MNPEEGPATVDSSRSAVWTRKSRVALVTILIMGMAALPGVREWGIRRDIQRWEKYRTEWEAKGEDFGTARWMPPLVANANDNFAAHPLIAGIWTSAGSASSVKLASIDTLVLPGMGGEQPADPEESWYSEHPDQAKAFLTALEPLDGFLSEFRVAAGRRLCRFDFDPESMMELDGDGRTSRLSKIMDLLTARAKASLAAGDEAAAVADLEAVFRAAGHLRSQRELLLTMIGAGGEVKARDVTRIALGKGRLSAESRVRLLVAFPPRPDLGAEICVLLRLARGGAFALFDKMPAASARRSGLRDYYNDWMFPPRRLNAINKWAMSRRIEPFLSSGGDPAKAKTTWLSVQERNSRDPAAGFLAGAFLSMQGGLPDSLFAQEIEADHLRADLAK